MNNSLKSIIALGLLSVLIISASGCTAQTSGDKLTFVTGTSHPADVAALLKKVRSCCISAVTAQPVRSRESLFHTSKSSNNGTEVTILRIDPLIDRTFTDKATNYGVTTIPTTVVIRGDGAVAKGVGLTDEQTLKNTIEDARQWK